MQNISQIVHFKNQRTAELQGSLPKLCLHRWTK
jgi:hypothetical protein